MEQPLPVVLATGSSGGEGDAPSARISQPVQPAGPLKTALWQRRNSAALPKLACLSPVAREEASQLAQESSQKSIRNFEIQRLLGQGALCAVHLAKRRSDGESVALKVMRTDDPEVQATAEKEFNLLRSFDHPNIVGAQDYWAGGGCAVIVLDYFNGATLDDAIRRSPLGHFSEAQSRLLTACLLQAVDYLHQRRVVHRDIKPGNVLVSPGLDSLKLVDFNAAATVGTSWALSPTGTRSFAAPEVIRGGPPAESNDTWTVGVCLYFMLTGSFPQRRMKCHSMSALLAAAEQPVDFTGPQFDEVSNACKTFLGRCVRIEACDRPAPMTLLKDRWLVGREAGRVKFERLPLRAAVVPGEDTDEDSDPLGAFSDSCDDDEMPVLRTKSEAVGYDQVSPLPSRTESAPLQRFVLREAKID